MLQAPADATDIQQGDFPLVGLQSAHQCRLLEPFTAFPWMLPPGLRCFSGHSEQPASTLAQQLPWP